MKIGFLGLDGAGKTSFLLSLGKKYSAISSSLKATKGIERNSIELLGRLEVNVWDFGGQKAYRDRYLRKSKDLEGLDVLFFVIDAQSWDRIDEALAYLKDILETAKDFNREHLIVCIHKADPDIQATKTFSKFVDKIQDGVEKLAPEAYAFPWTSIYDERSIFGAFSMGLRRISSQQELLASWQQQLLDTTKCSAMLLLTQTPYVIAKKAEDSAVGDLCEKVGLALVGMDHSLENSPLACESIAGRLKNGMYVLKSEKIENKSFYLLLYSQETKSAQAILESAKKSISQLPDLLSALGT